MENDSSSLWKNKEFIFFVFLRFSLIFGLFIQSTSIAYEIFRITQKEIYLGLIGLFEFVPILIAAFYAGYLVDKSDKRKILIYCMISFLITSCILLLVNIKSFHDSISRFAYLSFCYSSFFILGLTRAFSTPALFSMLSLIVDKKHYSKAIPISSSAFMIGAIFGPLAGGLLLASYGIEVTLAFTLFFTLISTFIALSLTPKITVENDTNKEKSISKSIKEGLSFIFSTPIIFAVLCLDMFAVFFGGSEALLPAVVEKVLNAGSKEFGLLRSAHGVGSLIMMLFLSFLPLLKGNVGPKLLGSIAMFGICIICFGISKNIYLSFFILMCGGAFDAVSMVIRQSILQIKTPEQLKGRVSSVNSIFVSSSNELGALESGVTASILGLVPSIILGGTMTILVVIIITLSIKSIQKVYLDQS